MLQMVLKNLGTIDDLNGAVFNTLLLIREEKRHTALLCQSTNMALSIIMTVSLRDYLSLSLP